MTTYQMKMDYLEKMILDHKNNDNNIDHNYITFEETYDKDGCLSGILILSTIQVKKYTQKEIYLMSKNKNNKQKL